jgi:3'(2'), 5'-bisphosphate nucleotidase
MRQDEITDVVKKLLPIARAAGDAIMATYKASNAEVQQKGDSSPVAAADLASHCVLLQNLAPLLPQCPVVSEEDDSSQVHRLGQGKFWLIDPMDGTKEFIAQNDEFTVNIALIDGGCSVLGVVYAPAIDAMYWGGAGLGAFRCVRGNTVSIQVATDSIAPNVCRVVVSRNHLTPETQAWIDRLGAVSVIQAGSSLKCCRVAEGSADIYPRLGPTCEWDTAAAQAVLEGAGGMVLDLRGEPLRYGKQNVLNPSFIAVRDIALIPND